MRLRRIVLLLWAANITGACAEDIDPREYGDGELAYLTVDVDFAAGSPHAPHPFPIEAVLLPVAVKAFQSNGKPAAVNREVSLYATTGVLNPEYQTITLSGGRSAIKTIELRYAYGSTVVRARDDRMKEDSTYAIGVSAPLYFSEPSIREIQSIDDSVAEFVGDRKTPLWRKRQVRITRGTLVVTGLTTDGMFVTDISNRVGANSLFVFAFNTPRELNVGDILLALQGTVYEFAGVATQLVDPAWLASGTRTKVPTPALLSKAMVDNKNAMEDLENALVEIRDVEVPEFQYESGYFAEFSQWPARGADGAIVKVMCKLTVPDFDPVAAAAKKLKIARITGNLTERPSSSDPDKALQSRWIILPRGPDDIEFVKP